MSSVYYGEDTWGESAAAAAEWAALIEDGAYSPSTAVNIAQNMRDLAAALTRSAGRIEYWIQRSMERDGATVLLHPDFDVTLDRPRSYDQSVLMGLLEVVDAETAQREYGYTPEHTRTETVPARWNMTKARKAAKLGTDAEAVIDRATIYGRATLSIKAKEGK